MKEELRKIYLAKRLNLTKEEVKLKSKIIVEKLLQLDIIKKSDYILSYNSFKNEVDLSELHKNLLKNKKIFIPKIIENYNFIPLLYTEETKKNKYGILEPNTNITLFDVLEKNKKYIIPVLCPGIVFDKRGYRIGFGKGYYDRFLSKKSDNIIFYKIGVCYSFQVIEKIKNNDTDIKMDKIVT